MHTPSNPVLVWRSKANRQNINANTEWWIKWEPFFQIGAVFCIPVAILCATLLTAYYTEGSNLKLEYVRLAVGILQPTDKKNEPKQELREWAVQILQNTSPVKLSSTAVKSLTDGESHFSYTPGYNYSSSYDSGSYSPSYDSNPKPIKSK